MGGKKIHVNRPRVRPLMAGPFAVEAFQSEDLNNAIMARLLAGVSTKIWQYIEGDTTGAICTSKSESAAVYQNGRMVETLTALAMLPVV